nr:hypothetical protein [uncultured Acetatifactor sp.]
MAEMEIKISVLDMPEVKRLLKRYKEIQRRRAWTGKARTGKARKRKWK